MPAPSPLASLQGQQLSQSTVDRVVALSRSAPIDTTELRASLGTALGKVFPLAPAEVKALDALPAATVATLLHVCDRAARSPNGTVTYTRGESGGPSFEFSHREVIRHDGSEPTIEVQIRCMK